MRFLFAVLIGLCLAAPSAFALEEEAAHIASIEKAMDRASVKGAVVVLVEKGEITWQHAFGVAGPGRPMTLETEFEAASNGKMLTGYLIMQLIEEGRYTLSTPLEDPRLKIAEGCRVPTLGEALSHTTGLGNSLTAETLEPACEPGKSFSYSGDGYQVIQSMVDRLASGTIEDVMEKRVFVPLGMTSASFERQVTPRFATGHADLVFGLLSGLAPGPWKWTGWALCGFFLLCFGATVVLSVRRHHPALALLIGLLAIPGWTLAAILLMAQIMVPLAPRPHAVDLASSLQLNAGDLAKFAAEMLEPTQIQVASRDLMTREAVRVNDQIAWAHGIGLDRTQGHTTWWHWGSNPGFQSLVVMDPETGRALVILTNTGGFLDFVSKRKGGYNFAKTVARDLLDLDGTWDLRS